jgi:hypothetical protein
MEGLTMLERLSDRMSAAMISGWIIYMLIGAVYSVVPATVNAFTARPSWDACRISATDFTPIAWVSWPVGVYKTVSLAHRLDRPVEKVWIARWCYWNNDDAFEALRPHPSILGSRLLIAPEPRPEGILKSVHHPDGSPLSLSEIQGLGRR